MVGILINSKDRIKYSKCPNLVLNAVIYLYSFFIQIKLYILGKSKILNHRVLNNLSLNFKMNGKR